ncbi:MULTISPECIES: hypothetical protein [Clostridium]|nr:MULTISPECIES: hypothetical protein [Clostridium]ADK13819.1 hypothetical protein CLJU_c07490 [Clostridium ljungdahlii DSM 13528]AGY77049.2 hypothetical protein CAETHG_2842 [Clostridium autoethanogenum DSM 10061]
MLVCRLIVMGVVLGLEVVLENIQDTAIGIMGVVNEIALFFCVYAVTGMKSIMEFTSSLSVWPILGVICLVAGVFAVIGFIKSEKSFDEKYKVQIKEV